MEPKIPAARPATDDATINETTVEPISAPERPVEPRASEATGEPEAHAEAHGEAERPAEPRADKAAGTTRARATTAKVTASARATATAKTAAKAVRAKAGEPAPVEAVGPVEAAIPGPVEATGSVVAAEPAPVEAVGLVETAEPASTGDASELEAAVPTPAPLWERISANPRYAPELLALAAVASLGGKVDRYTQWLVATYPHATADSIARYAAQRCARQAGYAALAGTVARPWGAFAGLVSYAWVQSRLVLLTAAAYGHDPRDPERVPELLVLLGLHPDLPAARAALDAAHSAPPRPLLGAEPGWLGLGRSLAAPLGRLTRRRRHRAFSLPGLRSLAGVVVDGSATEALARRAVAMYRSRPGS